MRELSKRSHKITHEKSAALDHRIYSGATNRDRWSVWDSLLGTLSAILELLSSASLSYASWGAKLRAPLKPLYDILPCCTEGCKVAHNLAAITPRVASFSDGFYG